MADEEKQEGWTIEDILNEIMYWVRCFRNAGVYYNAEPSERYKNIKEIIERPKSEVIGDPEKNPKGLPRVVIRKRIYRDSLLETINSAMLILPYDIVIKEIEETEYEPIDDTLPNPIYYKPVKKVRKLIQPVLEVLNFDKALIDPGDMGPPLRWYPLGQLSSIMSMGLNVLAHRIIDNVTDSEPIYWFVMLTDPTFGIAYLSDIVKNEFGESKANWVQSVYETVAQLSRVSSFIKWLSQTYKRQIMPNTQYQLLVRFLADESIGDQYSELMNLEENFYRLKNVCSYYYPTVKEVVTETTISTYELMGPMGTVTTHKIAYTSDGTYTKVDTQTEPVVSQQYIRSLRLFKQTVEQPHPCAKSNDIDHLRVGSLPCSNWDEVTKLSRVVTLENITEGYEFTASSFEEFKQKLAALFFCPGLVTASMKWELVGNKLTFRRTRINTYSS